MSTSDPVSPPPSGEPGRAPVAVKALRIMGGSATALTGLALLVLPGPGIVLIVAGLGILGRDIPLAARLQKWMIAHAKRAANGARNLGRTAPGTGE